MKFTARDRAYGLPGEAPGSKTVLRGERVYTRNDMRRAWENGYFCGFEAGSEEGMWRATHPNAISNPILYDEQTEELVSNTDIPPNPTFRLSDLQRIVDELRRDDAR